MFLNIFIRERCKVQVKYRTLQYLTLITEPSKFHSGNKLRPIHVLGCSSNVDHLTASWRGGINRCTKNSSASESLCSPLVLGVHGHKSESIKEISYITINLDNIIVWSNGNFSFWCSCNSSDGWLFLIIVIKPLKSPTDLPVLEWIVDIYL